MFGYLSGLFKNLQAIHQQYWQLLEVNCKQVVLLIILTLRVAPFSEKHLRKLGQYSISWSITYNYTLQSGWVCKHACRWVCVCACVRVIVHFCVRACMCVCESVFFYRCVRVCMFVCVSTHTRKRKIRRIFICIHLTSLVPTSHLPPNSSSLKLLHWLTAGCTTESSVRIYFMTWDKGCN